MLDKCNLRVSQRGFPAPIQPRAGSKAAPFPSFPVQAMGKPALQGSKLHKSSFPYEAKPNPSSFCSEAATGPGSWEAQPGRYHCTRPDTTSDLQPILPRGTGMPLLS